MTKPRVLMAANRHWFDGVFSKIDLDRLRAGAELLNDRPPKAADKEFLLARAKDTDVIITSWDSSPLDAEVIAAAPSLKLLCHAAGSIRPVSLNAPSNEGTRGMLRGSHFALLPAGALFTNTAGSIQIVDAYDQKFHRPPVDLVDLFLELSEKYDMEFYFGTYHCHSGNCKSWIDPVIFRDEAKANVEIISEAQEHYGHRKPQQETGCGSKFHPPK